MGLTTGVITSTIINVTAAQAVTNTTNALGADGSGGNTTDVLKITLTAEADTDPANINTLVARTANAASDPKLNATAVDSYQGTIAAFHTMRLNEAANGGLSTTIAAAFEAEVTGNITTDDDIIKLEALLNITTDPVTATISGKSAADINTKFTANTSTADHITIKPSDNGQTIDPSLIISLQGKTSATGNVTFENNNTFSGSFTHTQIAFVNNSAKLTVTDGSTITISSGILDVTDANALNIDVTPSITATVQDTKVNLLTLANKATNAYSLRVNDDLTFTETTGAANLSAVHFLALVTDSEAIAFKQVTFASALVATTAISNANAGDATGSFLITDTYAAPNTTVASNMLSQTIRGSKAQITASVNFAAVDQTNAANDQILLESLLTDTTQNTTYTGSTTTKNIISITVKSTNIANATDWAAAYTTTALSSADGTYA
jgi:hypothetical protein